MSTSGQSVKTVVFDLGKVLVDFDYSIAVARIAPRSKITPADFSGLLPLLFDYESGKLTSSEFFAIFCSRTGYCGELAEFADHFGDIFTPIEPMIAVQQELASRGFPTFVLSNTNELAVRHIRKTFPFFGRFTGYVFSYEHGSMKPAPELYAVLEQMSGCRGPEILYFDDRAENVEAAAARGWRALVHETPETTIQTMTSLGLLQR